MPKAPLSIKKTNNYPLFSPLEAPIIVKDPIRGTLNCSFISIRAVKNLEKSFRRKTSGSMGKLKM